LSIDAFGVGIMWHDDFSVGVRLLDDQHKRMIEIVNQLAGHPQVAVDSELVSDSLTRLTQYALEHFHDEESLMEAVGYPDLERHKALHQEFRQKIAECCVAATLHVGVMPHALVAYLHDWLSEHVLVEDMKYKPWLAGREKEEG
jgi:hemerythrin